jgi:hypothetical protein
LRRIARQPVHPGTRREKPQIEAAENQPGHEGGWQIVTAQLASQPGQLA